MIKASKFSLEAGSQLAESIGKFKIPEKFPDNKSKIWFLSGDMTQYGHKNIKMSQQGYDLVGKSIKNYENHVQNETTGQPLARASIAKALSYDQYTLSEKDIIMTHGANIGLYHCINALVNEGENILVPEPSYPFYKKVAKAFGVDARPYKLVPENQWQIDLSHLESLIDEKTKYIWIVNPSNPCGSVFSKDHLKEILDLANKHNTLVVGDEVYFEEVFENQVFTSIGHVNPEQSVIALGGMEKTFCTPGWSVSWIAFYDKNKNLTEVQKAIKQSAELINSPPEIISGALPDILDDLTLEFTKKLMPIFQESYDYCFQKLSEIEGLKPIEAQGTFYLSALIELEKFENFNSDYDFLQKLLEEENIFILSLSCFGGGVNGFRLMSAAPLQYYDGFVERLSSFCQRHIKK